MPGECWPGENCGMRFKAAHTMSCPKVSCMFNKENFQLLAVEGNGGKDESGVRLITCRNSFYCGKLNIKL
jgi:hypothetical protein